MTREDKLIVLRLIEGHSAQAQNTWKVTDKKMNLESSKEFLTEVEVIKEFSQQKDNQKTQTQPSSWSNENIATRNMKEVRISVQTWEKMFELQKERSFSDNYKRRIKKIRFTDPPTEKAEIYALLNYIYNK